jgi:hypothetical protein
MRPGWSQTGMKIEIVNMFTWDLYENHKIFNLFPLTGNFLFQMAFVLIACVVPMSRLQLRPVWNVFVFTFIPVWIHAGLNSCRSEVSWLGPAGGIMTWDQSELFSSRSHVNICYKLYSDRNEMIPVWLCSGLM